MGHRSEFIAFEINTQATIAPSRYIVEHLAKAPSHFGSESIPKVLSEVRLEDNSLPSNGIATQVPTCFAECLDLDVRPDQDRYTALSPVKSHFWSDGS
jgi:hypothetical protein